MAARRAILVAAAAALLAGAAPEADLARGAEILAPFKERLQAALRAGLARGPAEAIEACRSEAPEIAASLSREGVRVGRTSHRLRNPANAPPAWAAPLLEEFVADPAARAPRVVRLGDARRGYVEPILMQPLCVTCHGDAVPEAVAAKLAELYPEDRAVGFAVGELRGLFWAEFPAAAGGDPR